MISSELFRIGLTRHSEGIIGPELVSVGIPFPLGLLKDARQIFLTDAQNDKIKASLVPTARWQDNSIKWLNIEFLFDLADADASYVIFHKMPVVEGAPINTAVVETGKELLVKRNGYTFTLDKNVYGPFKNIVTDKGELVCSASHMQITLIDGEKLGFTVKKTDFVDSEIVTKINMSGAISSHENRTIAEFDSTISIYDEIIKVDVTLRNPKSAKHYGGLWDLGDPNSLYIKDVSQYLNFEPLSEAFYSTGSGLKPSQSFSIYQGSSGGKKSKHLNHVDKNGKVTIDSDGFEVNSREGVIEKGLRSDVELVAQGNGFAVAVTIDKFWQNFPKVLELDSNCVRLGFFPKECRAGYELQPGEQKTHTYFIGITKEHPRLNWVHNRMNVQIPVSWYQISDAVPYLASASNGLDHILDGIINSWAAGENTLFDKREALDEFGWRNFGDIFADHECFEVPTGSDTSHFVSHYNNQYDHLNSMLFQFFKEGNGTWFELASDLAKHIIDIDIYHTQNDRSCYNNGLFWHTDHYVTAATSTHRSLSIETKRNKRLKSYGGGPGYDHVYTRGLKYYYFITADEKAKKTALDLAEWAIRGFDGTATFAEKAEELLRAKLRPRKKNGSMQPYSFDGPGRSSGNALNVCVDAFELTNDDRYLRKAEKLIRKCIAPDDDIESRNLLEPNMRWMYTIFLLAMESYLSLKRQKAEYDAMYQYGVDVLKNYAEWMSKNELSFMDRKEELDYPNYATRAAQDLRKCAVMLAAMKYCGKEEGEQLYSSSLAIYQKATSYLATTDKRFLVRPAAVIMALEGPLKYGFGDGRDKKMDIDVTQNSSVLPDEANNALQIFSDIINYTSFSKEWGVITRRLEELWLNFKLSKVAK